MSLAFTIVLFLATSLAHAAAVLDDYVFVQPNGSAEWSSAGDFNGDGLLDVVIVDRKSGAYRIGYQAPGGEMTWTTPRASGIADVSGVGVGNLLNAGSHALAFTAEEANRVNIASATSLTQASQPNSVHLSAVGPNQVVALNIGGPGDTAFHDLVVPTSWNGAAPHRLTTIRNTDGATFSTLSDNFAAQRLERGNRVIIKDASPAVLAILARGLTDTVRVVSYQGGPANTFLEVTNLASGSEYTIGRFANTGLRHFLSFRSGHSNLWTHPIREPVPGTFEMGAATGFNMGDAMTSITTLPGATESHLLVIFNNGTHATAYSFDGTNAPVPIGEFEPPTNGRWLGATPTENNGVRLHATGTGKSMSAEVIADGSRTGRSLQYSFSAATGSYALQRTDTLPPVSDLSGQANVFQFQTEPFVAAAPRLLHSGNAGDWSSLFSLAGGPPQVGVFTEFFVDSEHGLDNPTPTLLGASHALTQFGLVNQYMNFVSLFSLAPGSGDPVVEVSAQPAGGLYGQSVSVRFNLSAPAFQVWYRLNPTGAWQLYSGTAVPIFTNSVLQFRARAPGGSPQTSIRTERYTFKQAPGELDSDGDGVPDYVEIANGLDPRSGSDHDADGFSDLDELLKNTLPGNENNHPDHPGFEQHAAVDFALTPRPLNGTTGTETLSRGGPRITVYDGAGAPRGNGLVSTLAAFNLPATALVTNVFIEPAQKILVAATEPHFEITALIPDRRIGRELVRIIPAPEISPVVVNYAFGGAVGNVNAEALNWIAAAQAAYLNATNAIRFHDLTIGDTTVAALLEEKLRRVVVEAAPEMTNLTLFPFRPLDAGRHPFDHTIRELIEHADAARPAYDLKQLFHSLEAMVQGAPNAQVQSLNTVAREMYRVSSVFNNAAPGQFPLPLDALRQFIRTGTIHSNYLAAGLFLAPVVAEAGAGVQFVLDHLGSRPVTNLTLRIRPDTFAGVCTVVETADLASTPINLFAPGGGAFDFPDTFTLVPGSVVQVIGRPDVSSSTCGGPGIEVLDMSLAAIPARSDGDADGNLLIDTWEQMLLGLLGADPFGDEDGDGYTNLQEMFDGSDPSDRMGVPPGPLAGLKLPALEIEPSPAGGLLLAWTWPEAYRNRVQFQLMATDDLNTPLTPQVITPVHQGGDRFTASVPNPGAGARFFTVVVKLQL